MTNDTPAVRSLTGHYIRIHRITSKSIETLYSECKRLIPATIEAYLINLGTTMKLLVRNLDRSTSEKELKTLFQQYGTVQSCTLVMDRATKASKGFGFVVMPKQGEGKAAFKNLNGYELGANKIRVKKAEEDAPKED